MALGALQEVSDDGLHRADKKDVSVQEIAQLGGAKDGHPSETTQDGRGLDDLVDDPGAEILEHIAGNLSVANPGVHKLGAAR